MLDFLQRDPEKYVEMLAATIGPAGPDSGAFCLGAAESVAVISGIEVTGPAWHRIVDGAIDYLRSLRVPVQQVKPYMRARWTEHHSPDEWATWPGPQDAHDGTGHER
ncbi:hypothetical protein [Solwaraspora sp. WMMD792]|uniref:hypothetical protein n=1 Tax=Solwaraspora sp. WMMD792 TaxID=3016099 RepID=UPI0024179887|nr:hypothetical protein [Solwaraspora sp. WMMD792]MDG4771259.1 hypothetical protein [Solwaraspora sp. WMMD792]